MQMFAAGQKEMIITEQLGKSTVPARPKHGHMGTFGHTLIVGGSRQFVGAPILHARGGSKGFIPLWSEPYKIIYGVKKLLTKL
jgi:hypothetical protein